MTINIVKNNVFLLLKKYFLDTLIPTKVHIDKMSDCFQKNRTLYNIGTTII